MSEMIISKRKTLSDMLKKKAHLYEEGNYTDAVQSTPPINKLKYKLDNNNNSTSSMSSLKNNETPIKNSDQKVVNHTTSSFARQAS